MPSPVLKYKIPNTNVGRLFQFMFRRHEIWVNRFKWKMPKPWTTDNILLTYRFCNMYRELDTVTQWIATNWRQPHMDDPNLWFAMTVARYINWPDTLEDIGYPVPWKPASVMRQIEKRQDAGDKVFTGAYMISQAGTSLKKADYVLNHVLTPAWDRRAELIPQKGESLATFYKKLSTCHGLGKGFMSGQVIADLKYAGVLAKAKDRETFAVSGPGSRRGLNRVLGRHIDTPWTEDEWYRYHQNLRERINPLVAQEDIFMKHGLGLFDAQDLQNCLCEFDKYERVRNQEGRPRSTYPGI